MSNKCEHNNHGHFVIWMAVLWMLLDCSGRETREESQIDALTRRVQQLEMRRP